MDRAHLAMETWIVTVVAVLAAVGATAMAPVAPPRSRLPKVPKVYNALITSDIPLLPSRAETAATAAVGPVFLYSTHLPVVLEPQASGTTPQNHLDKLTQLQNQLKREDVQQLQIQLPRCCIQQQLLNERQPVQQHLFPERQLPAQSQYPVKQLPVQQQLFPERQLSAQSQYPVKQLPVQQQLFPERQLPVQLPAGQLPVQQQHFPERQSPIHQQLFPERQQLPGRHHAPLQAQQVPVRHLSSEQLSPQQLTRQPFDDVPYQKPRPVVQQQYSQVDPQLQHQKHLQLQIQHQKQLQVQVHQQKQLQLSQFVSQKKAEEDSSYLPMPEMNSYQPPPSVHIDEIKNNKPSNVAIPDVPPPPLPVGKRLQSYSYNSPVLSPPPPTNHHVPYG